jgi:large subunit ribosomal protein L25
METLSLQAEKREHSTKGHANRLRESGITPAIFYGYEAEPVMLQVKNDDLKKVLAKVRKESVFIKLNIKDSASGTEKLSILKDVQINTLKKRLDHADFYEIRMDKALSIDVPIVIIGVPVGVEKGGELNFIKREIKLSGLPLVLPETVEVDVTNLEIGDSAKVGDVKLAEGVVALDSEEIVIANVAITRAAMAAAGVAAREAQAADDSTDAGEGSTDEG